MENLEKRIQRLEDIEAIRQLKHYYYCDCVDRAVAGDVHASEETLSRFADDIVADFTGFPLAEGKEAVSAFYAQGVPSMLSWSQHRVMTDNIQIDGDTAKGTWYLDCPVVFKSGNPTGVVGKGIIIGRYEEEYVRENGVWKWKRITALLDTIASAEKGWDNANQVFKNR